MEQNINLLIIQLYIKCLIKCKCIWKLLKKCLNLKIFRLINSKKNMINIYIILILLWMLTKLLIFMIIIYLIVIHYHFSIKCLLLIILFIILMNNNDMILCNIYLFISNLDKFVLLFNNNLHKDLFHVVMINNYSVFLDKKLMI